MNAPARIPRDQLGKFLGKGETKQSRARGRAEEKIQTAFATWCKLCLGDDVLWLSIPNERKAPAAQIAALKAMGMRPGAADFLIVYQGRAHFIEFKSPTGHVAENQRDFARAAGVAGAKVAVCRSSQAARHKLDEWGIPHREVTA